MKKYIVSNPQILSGMPVIAGTRVPIARILYLLKEGSTIDELHEYFPHVSKKVFQHVINEIAEHFASSHNDSQVF